MHPEKLMLMEDYYYFQGSVVVHPDSDFLEDTNGKLKEV